MKPYKLNPTTLVKMRELIEANFAGRDELYAAAETLDDGARKIVCQRLAEHLAGHAAELQQIVLATGGDRFDLEDTEFIDYVAEQAFLHMVQELHGPGRVIASLEQCERHLKDKYDQALEATSEPEAEGVLERQRNEVEFGEQVLHSMQHSPDAKPGDDDSS